MELGSIQELPAKKQGHPLFLGPELDKKFRLTFMLFVLVTVLLTGE
jgi:hypothetical protein